MTLQIQTEGQQTRINLSGELNIQAASELKEALLSALQQSDYIQVKADFVDEVDFGFLQVLVSAKKTAEATGKQLHLEAPLPDMLQQALNNSGVVL